MHASLAGSAKEHLSIPRTALGETLFRTDHRAIQFRASKCRADIGGSRFKARIGYTYRVYVMKNTFGKHLRKIEGFVPYLEFISENIILLPPDNVDVNFVFQFYEYFIVM